MATSKKSLSTGSDMSDQPAGSSGVEPRIGGGSVAAGGTPPGQTGRYLVLLRKDAVSAGVKALTDVAGLKVASTADFEGGAVDAATLSSTEALVFDKLAVAVINTPLEQMRSLSTANTGDNGILAIEPERVVYALEEGPVGTILPTIIGDAIAPPALTAEIRLPVQYLLGYRDAVNHLVDRVLGAGGLLAASALTAADVTPTVFDETELTWGLQVTKVVHSQFSGKGIQVAVLDTGFDLGHPDFVGRNIVSQSFVDGEDVQDGHGHGTHCIGTACGSKQPSQLPRYGIAYEATIYAGKVLSNQGSGADGGILAGINWAMSNGCHIISMSLGAPTAPGQSFSRIYENVAQRALAAGTLIIAAAGNESHRPGQINPVGHPANCPSILAVAALEQQLQVTWFSCGGVNLSGGEVDIAAPGLQVRSSWPRPTLYKAISGTSMATPHVAGIAALHAEANPDVRGGALGWLLLQGARRLDLPAHDIGAGLVQAP